MQSACRAFSQNLLRCVFSMRAAGKQQRTTLLRAGRSNPKKTSVTDRPAKNSIEHLSLRALVHLGWPEV